MFKCLTACKRDTNEKDLVQVTLPTGNLISHINDFFSSLRYSKPENEMFKCLTACKRDTNEKDLVQVTLPTGNLISHINDFFSSLRYSKPTDKKDIVFSRIKLPKGLIIC